jgi:serine/threonine protein phosphatase PrpC
MVSVLAGATSAAWIWQSNHTHRTQNEASAETATVPTCFSIVQRGAHNHWTVKNLKESADASDTRPTNQEDLQPEGGDYAAQGKHYDVSPYETHQQATACSLVRPHTGTPIHGRPVLWITLLARQSTRSLDSPRLLFFFRLQVSVRAIKGARVTMEDEYYISPGGRFTAVFDGHGGGGVSTWLRTKLYGLVCHYLKETHWEEQTEETAGRTPSLSAHVAALRKAFGQVEKDILAQETLAYQGSTAVVVAMHESDDGHRTLVAANVGDSRAILSRRGKAIDLTRDHKPNEEREKARILNMGEVIEWDSLSKVHRVRNLSLSRAIGDRYAKPVVSSQVEVKLFPITEEGDEFFLLASDGLWDVMTSQEVVSYVHSRFEKELKREQLQTQEDKENYKLVLRRNMARSVAREALRRGTGDNICVVMVWMKDLQNSKAP